MNPIFAVIEDLMNDDAVADMTLLQFRTVISSVLEHYSTEEEDVEDEELTKYIL